MSNNFLVNFSQQSNIRIRLSNVEPGWETALGLAISDWNARPNSNIKFNIAPNGLPFDVYVTMNSNLSSMTRASTTLPSGTRPGNRIFINPIYNGNSISQKRRTMVHELGHTIGFLHTDTYNQDIIDYNNSNNTNYTGAYIKGTAENDPNSVMRSTGGFPWNGFTLYDGLLLTLNYPSNPPPANSSALYRYYGMSNGDHFYSINWNEAEGDILTTTGYRYELIEGYTPSVREVGTVPLHRLIRTSDGEHLYTTNPAEVASSQNVGYKYEGIACYVFKSQQPGTIPLRRLISNYNGEHFYTTSQGEASSIVASGAYKAEGIACYIYPRPF